MRKFLFALLAAVVIALACDSTLDVTGPTPPPPPQPEPPPPIVEPTEFSWDRYVGFSAFALFKWDDETITEVIQQAMAAGFNTSRVCAETEFWGDEYAYPRVGRDLEVVRRGLDAIASVPGAMVLLMADCTLKGQLQDSEREQWIERVSVLAAEYPNVALEVVNEPWNHGIGKQSLRRSIDAARRAGVRNVTVDDHVCLTDPPDKLEFRYYNIGAAPADFHYCRDVEGVGPWDPQVDPEDVTWLNKLLRANRGFLVLSETVAYADFSGICQGLRTCDMTRIEAAAHRCMNLVEGCRWTFHSEAGLRGTDYTFPRLRIQ